MLRQGFKHLQAQRFTCRLNRTAVRHFHASQGIAMPQISFKLADIGEGIAEVELLQWFVQPGETVKQFQNVCEVQSDKATVEITSRYDGVVTKLHYDVGQMAQVGSTLVDIEVSDEVANAQSTPAAPKKSKTPIKVEQIKKAVSAPAFTPAPTPVETTPEVSAIRGRPVMTKGGKVLTSPSVRRLAREHGIDLEDVPSSGDGDRIVKGDILNYIKYLADEKASAPVPEPSVAQNSSIIGSNSISKTVDYLTESIQVPVSRKFFKLYIF